MKLSLQIHFLSKLILGVYASVYILTSSRQYFFAVVINRFTSQADSYFTNNI